VIRRISRDESVRMAKNDDRLRQFVRPVVPFMRDLLSKGERIIIEGTQGFGLSLLHTPHYPYATSRDTSAAAFVSEAGLSPLDVDDIVLVIRTYPIRVGGNSGPLPKETDWATVSNSSESFSKLVEFTSVTKTVRRVAAFDADVVLKSIAVNNPSTIVLNHLDYIDMSVSNGKLTSVCSEFISSVQNELGEKIDFIGCGPSNIRRLSHVGGTN